MIDMEFYEVPKDVASFNQSGVSSDMFPDECCGF